MQNNKPGQKQAKVLVPGAWEKAIKQYLIARKKMHVLSYQNISNRLVSYHVNQSPQNLSAKFNQGKLSASLFVSSLIAMDEKEIDLVELQLIFEEIKSKKGAE
ncbi:MAG: hypothetical protein IIB73_04070 [Proteobacteria bacterium]|nr:hypothetical protein [Pseudomonadota bacterium]